MRNIYSALVIVLFLSTTSNIFASNFDNTIDSWGSYKDVGNWLNDNFKFDKQRQKFIKSRLKTQGPDGLLIRDPQKTFNNSTGYCADSAHFAREAINYINPEYNAQWVFIKNKANGPNHWVTGFYVDDKLYIMDYGTGPKLKAMKGIHGPYQSLNEYKDYLISLNLHGFEVSKVYWRDMPGTVD